MQFDCNHFNDKKGKMIRMFVTVFQFSTAEVFYELGTIKNNNNNALDVIRNFNRKFSYECNEQFIKINRVNFQRKFDSKFSYECLTIYQVQQGKLFFNHEKNEKKNGVYQ